LLLLLFLFLSGTVIIISDIRNNHCIDVESRVSSSTNICLPILKYLVY